MSYASDYAELFRRGATFVDKILKGAKAGDLPVELPTKLDLVVNTKNLSVNNIYLRRHTPEADDGRGEHSEREIRSMHLFVAD